MDVSKLYQFAYRLHYNDQNYVEAYKIYNKILNEYPNTKEEKYALSQIQNLKKIGIELANNDSDSALLDKHIAEEEEQSDVDIDNIKVSTTNFLYGYIIEKYIDVVSSEIVLGTGMISELSAGISDILGVRSSAFENKLLELRNSSLLKIKKVAAQKGANAVIGINFDYTTFSNNILGLVVTGTAVRIKEEINVENISNVLEELYELKDKKIISENEYNEKRQILLDKIK